MKPFAITVPNYARWLAPEQAEAFSQHMKSEPRGVFKGEDPELLYASLLWGQLFVDERPVDCSTRFGAQEHLPDQRAAAWNRLIDAGLARHITFWTTAPVDGAAEGNYKPIGAVCVVIDHDSAWLARATWRAHPAKLNAALVTSPAFERLLGGLRLRPERAFLKLEVKGVQVVSPLKPVLFYSSSPFTKPSSYLRFV